jgi:pimeloyl-ACP methyl ester carboxylesterase
VLAGLLPQIAVPVTIINGRHDRVVPVANAEFLDQRLPVSRHHVSRLDADLSADDREELAGY